jgi:hypothetical protein
MTPDDNKDGIILFFFFFFSLFFFFLVSGASDGVLERTDLLVTQCPDVDDNGSHIAMPRAWGGRRL